MWAERGRAGIGRIEKERTRQERIEEMFRRIEKRGGRKMTSKRKESMKW